MPIVNMAWNPKDIPADAHNVRGSCCVANGSMGNDVIGPRPMWTYETQVGVCLHESESNGSWDSDFYMTYWDEKTQAPVTVMFATTRGWTYPCLGSRPDATPEVRAKFEAYRVRQEAQRRADARKAKALVLRTVRNQLQTLAHEHDLPYARILKLRRLYSYSGKFEGCIALFGKRIRSGFRLSMREQLVKWLRGQSQYGAPFSRKQLEWL